MQLKNKIFLGISLFMSQLNYASQDQRPPSVNNVAPEIIADVSEKRQSLMKEFMSKALFINLILVRSPQSLKLNYLLGPKEGSELKKVVNLMRR